MTRKPFRINWFRLNRELHRDLGFLCVGLTIVFAVSGIALNHLHDWNPNYIVERSEQAIELSNEQSDKALNQALLELFMIEQPVKASYWDSPTLYKIFFEGGGTLSADFKAQLARYENVRPRHVFKEFNQLHLNNARHGWIVFSDIYAGVLIFLAISGLFMVKGKYSPWRLRRGWLVIVGGLIPAVYIFLL